MNNNVLRFRAPEQAIEPKPMPDLPPKLHPKVKRRRITWLILMVFFLCWFISQWIVQENRIMNKEELLHKRQQELAATQAKTNQLKKEITRLRDYDYLMEQAHKHGYGKPGERNMQMGDE